MAQRLTRKESEPTGCTLPDAFRPHSRMVSAVMDGKVKGLGKGPPEFSSASTAWSGFMLERHGIVGNLEEVGWFWHSTHVGTCIAGSSVVRVSGDAGNAHGIMRPGSVFIFPRGCDRTNISISSQGHCCVVTELDRARLARLLPDDVGPSDERLAPQLNIEDPHIMAIMGNMMAEASEGCPSGSLYGESLSLALAAHVTACYSGKSRQGQTAEHRFSRAQLQTIVDYIHAHLTKDLGLVELADAIDLSPRHFSRLFRNTFGTTPHRYVMDERIHEVKALLATKRLSIAEIGEALGFADQSHLTNVFRKATGLTPRRYQQER
jgi:AraC family transcriptional regulator